AEGGVASQPELDELDAKAQKHVEEAVSFADQSPHPELDSLYDDIYVLGDQVGGWYSVDERSPETHRGEAEREAGTAAHELAEAGAAYAERDESRARRLRRGESNPGLEDRGEGQTDPDASGGEDSA